MYGDEVTLQKREKKKTQGTRRKGGVVIGGYTVEWDGDVTLRPKVGHATIRRDGHVQVVRWHYNIHCVKLCMSTKR